MPRSHRHRDFVSTLTAIALLAGPALPTSAQTAAPIGEKLRRAVQTPQSVAAIRLAPRAVLTSPSVQFMPVEVVTAAGLEYVGVDPVDVELIEAVVEPPLGSTVYYGAAVRFAAPFDLEDLRPEVWRHCEGESDSRGGVRYESRDPNLPSFRMANERTLLVASPAMMKKLTKRPRPKADGPFHEWLDGLDRRHELHVALNFEALRPLVQMGLAMAGDEVPEELRPHLGPMVRDLRFVEAGVGVNLAAPWRIAIEATDEAAADRLQQQMNRRRDEAIAKLHAESAKLLASDDLVERAVGQWSVRVGPRITEALLPQRDGLRFSYQMPHEGDEPSSVVLTQTAVIGVLVALLLPAVQAAREAARRNVSLNNVKQLNLAWHNYHDVHDSFPPQAITSDDGRPLLSWRVAVLPYVGEQQLYDAFRLDEPWDSPHNEQLISRMPSLLLDPSSPGLTETDGKTHYLGVTGRRAVLNGGPRGKHIREILDGASKTLSIVQVDDANAVIWTKPEDYNADVHAANPFAGIGALHPGVFLGGFCDGHARSIPVETPAETLRAAMTINGLERIELP